MTTHPLRALDLQNTTFEALDLRGPRIEKSEATSGSFLGEYLAEMPKAPLASALGAFGSTIWYGLSYSGPSSAPWQSIVGSLGAGLVAAPFEAYENYTLYRQGKRSLSRSLLDGVSDTLSASAASYLGSSLSSLIISSALGRSFPIRGTLGAGVLAAGIGFGVWHALSAVKAGLLKDMQVS